MPQTAKSYRLIVTKIEGKKNDDNSDPYAALVNNVVFEDRNKNCVKVGGQHITPHQQWVTLYQGNGQHQFDVTETAPWAVRIEANYSGGGAGGVGITDFPIEISVPRIEKDKKSDNTLEIGGLEKIWIQAPNRNKSVSYRIYFAVQ